MESEPVTIIDFTGELFLQLSKYVKYCTGTISTKKKSGKVFVGNFELSHIFKEMHTDIPYDFENFKISNYKHLINKDDISQQTYIMVGLIKLIKPNVIIYSDSSLEHVRELIPKHIICINLSIHLEDGEFTSETQRSIMRDIFLTDEEKAPKYNLSLLEKNNRLTKELEELKAKYDLLKSVINA